MGDQAHGDAAAGSDPVRDESVLVYDVDGHPHRVPLRPDGEYIERLERAAARRDARRPAEDVLRELTDAVAALTELERSRLRP